MAAHRGNQERPGLKSLEVIRSGFQDPSDIGNSPAAGSQGDSVPGPNSSPEVQLFESDANCFFNVLTFRAVELLANAYKFGISHSESRKKQEEIGTLLCYGVKTAATTPIISVIDAAARVELRQTWSCWRLNRPIYF